MFQKLFFIFTYVPLKFIKKQEPRRTPIDAKSSRIADYRNSLFYSRAGSVVDCAARKDNI